MTHFITLYVHVWLCTRECMVLPRNNKWMRSLRANHKAPPSTGSEMYTNRHTHSNIVHTRSQPNTDTRCLMALFSGRDNYSVTV